MRRFLILFLLAVLVGLPMQAQRRGGYGTPPPPTRPTRGNTVYGRGSYYDYGAPVYFGLRTGWNVSHVTSDMAALDARSRLSRMNLGLVLGSQILPYTPVAFETGLLYSGKGGKLSSTGQRLVYNLEYLEVPMVMKYIAPMTESMYLQPFMGLYMAAGVAGQAKDFETRTTFSSFDENLFRRFDAGLRLGCGVNVAMFYAELSYDFGLANISRDDFQAAHNRCLSFTLGLDF